ncbi:hypothetical protein BC828DRAFT_137780 [Blastocladiella britannica]|nr:hypothetical protein BC828DRAFT_137780 [Blastocladiella britannica]
MRWSKGVKRWRDILLFFWLNSTTTTRVGRSVYKSECANAVVVVSLLGGQKRGKTRLQTKKIEKMAPHELPRKKKKKLNMREQRAKSTRDRRPRDEGRTRFAKI